MSDTAKKCICHYLFKPGSMNPVTSMKPNIWSTSEINSTISFMPNIKRNRIQVISINIISGMSLRFNS